MLLFRPDYQSTLARSASTPPPATESAKGGGAGKAKKDKTPTTHTLSDKAVAAARAKGLVTFSGKGKPPTADDVLVKHPKTGKNTMICSNFVTQDYFCKHGDKCNFLHLLSIMDLPADKRSAYKEFVDKHEQLAWANKG